MILPDIQQTIPTLTVEDTLLLNAMKLHRWYYTIGEFADVEHLVALGVLEAGENPIEWCTWPAYRKTSGYTFP